MPDFHVEIDALSARQLCRMWVREAIVSRPGSGDVGEKQWGLRRGLANKPAFLYPRTP